MKNMKPKLLLISGICLIMSACAINNPSPANNDNNANSMNIYSNTPDNPNVSSRAASNVEFTQENQL
jgi:hypothetical protein